MISILIAILLAVLAYWLLVVLTGSAILGIVAAILILVCGIASVSRGGL